MYVQVEDFCYFCCHQKIIDMEKYAITQQSLVVVVPCYNEEEVLNETHLRLSEVCQKVMRDCPHVRVHQLYVDDGSRDKTWEIIVALSQSDPQVHGLKLSHNNGHQRALWAGLEWAAQHADAAISIDADLQDDVNVIEQMVQKWQAGVDIVYGVRRERPTDTWFKKHSAQLYYKLLRKMGGDVVYNHADYRLMSRRALVALMSYPERNLFIRGMVRTLGFVEGVVEYDRAERFAGESKYPLRKMLAFALDGITSFSVRPLSLIVWIGLVIIFLAVMAVIYALVQYALGNTLPGWTSLLISIWFVGGAMLTSLGVIGIYVGKIYSEVKRRPRYFVQEEV